MVQYPIRLSSSPFIELLSTEKVFKSDTDTIQFEYMPVCSSSLNVGIFYTLMNWLLNQVLRKENKYVIEEHD
jgi:hypothetical protein